MQRPAPDRVHEEIDPRRAAVDLRECSLDSRSTAEAVSRSLVPLRTARCFSAGIDAPASRAYSPSEIVGIDPSMRNHLGKASAAQRLDGTAV